MENNNYEQEIDLKDLLFAVLRKWRPIILVAVVLAVLLGGYKGYKGIASMNDPKQVEKQTQADQEALQAYNLKKSGLEREIDNLTKSIEGQQSYVENSVLMKINPYDEYVSNISIYVYTDYQIMPGSVYQNYDIRKSLISAYISMAVNGELSNYLSNEMGIEAQYAQELISVSSNYETSTLSLSIKNATADECDKMSELIMDFFKDKQKTLVTSVGEHTLNVVNEATYSVVDLQLETTQKNTNYNLSTMESSLNEKTAELAKLEEPKPTLTSKLSALKGGIKYFILGGVLGGFMMVFFICVGFLMSDKLNSEKELRKRFGIRILGVFESKGKKKPFAFVDKWLDKLEGKAGQEIAEDTVYAVAAANIENYVGDAKNLLVTSSLNDETLNEVMEKLSAKLGSKGIHLSAASSVIRNPETIKLAAQCDGVVLVEKKGTSTFAELERELDAFAQLDKTVIGCVVR